MCHHGICNSTRDIEVFVKRIKAISDAPHHHERAVWILPGGPGASSANEEMAMMSLYMLLGNTADVYTTDHRGTGRSEFLQCEAAQALAAGSPNGEEISMEELPKCVHDILFEIDNKTAAFSVSSAAADIVMILDELDEYDDVYLYGVSYGTYWLERVMKMAPRKVRGYVFDGVIPDAFVSERRGFSLESWNQNTLAPAERFFTYCAEDSSCPLKFKSTESILQQLKTQFDEVDQTLERNMCAQDLLRMTGGQLPSFELRNLFSQIVLFFDKREIIPSLLARFARCSDSDHAELTLVLPQLLQQLASAFLVEDSQDTHLRTQLLPWSFNLDPTRALSTMLYNLIVVSELWLAKSLPLKESQEAFIESPFGRFGFFPAIKCILNPADQRSSICDEMEDLLGAPFPKSEPFRYTPDSHYRSPPRLPLDAGAMFIVGGLDFQTPKTFGEAMYEETEGDNKLLLEFKYGPHSSGTLPTTREDETGCGLQIIASFVEARANVSIVNTSCLSTLPRLRFSDDYVQEVITALQNEKQEVYLDS